jgi:hypothetical protein
MGFPDWCDALKQMQFSGNSASEGGWFTYASGTETWNKPHEERISNEAPIRFVISTKNVG